MEFRKLTKTQKLSLSLLGISIIVFTVIAIYQVVKTEYVVFYKNDDLEQVSKVTELLAEKNIKFELANLGNTVLVPENSLNMLNIQLAKTHADFNSSAGFELFDNLDYSMTENAQKITYQRAIQGELEKTIKAYREISSARVHVTIPEKRLFRNEQSKIKASVSLWYEQGMTFNGKQIKGVQELVASAIEGLKPQNVIILDELGNQISTTAKTNSSELLSADHESNNKLEQILTKKANSILSIYFNTESYAVSVTTTLNRVRERKTTRSLLLNDNNEGVIVKKKERINETKVNSLKGEQPKEKQLEIEYQHGIETAEKEVIPGEISKISVAVAIISDIDESVVVKVKNLIHAGLGLDNSRGDKLSVEVFPVLNETKEPAEVTALEVKPLNTFTPIAQNSFFPYNNSLVAISVAISALLILIFVYLLRRNSIPDTERLALQSQFSEWLEVKEGVKHV